MRERRVRVLRVIARMNVGGPARQVTALMEGLDAGRYEHRLVVGEVGADEADELELRGGAFDVRRIDALGRAVHPLRDLSAGRAIATEIRAFRPDIVHTHTAKAGVLGRLGAIRAGVDHIVHTFHGHLLHGYFPPAVTAAITQTERTLAGRTDVLAAVGARVRDDLLVAGVGEPGQYVVVPPGIHLAAPPERMAARRALELDSGAPVVAYVGRLTGIKRPDRLVDVARQVLASLPDTVFVIAGGGDLAADTRRRARDLGRHVRFLGWRSDIETVYAAADAVVLTSDNEGMPVSLIEAALCGVPSVTTGVGSAAEVVQDGVNGFVVSTRVGSLAARLTRLLADEALRRRMGEAARTHAEGAYTGRRLVSDTEAIYERLAASP